MWHQPGWSVSLFFLISLLIYLFSFCSARFLLQLGHPHHRRGLGRSLGLDAHVSLQELRGAAQVEQRRNGLRGGLWEHGVMTPLSFCCVNNRHSFVRRLLDLFFQPQRPLWASSLNSTRTRSRRADVCKQAPLTKNYNERTNAGWRFIPCAACIFICFAFTFFDVVGCCCCFFFLPYLIHMQYSL